MIKNIAKSAFRALGYELHRYKPPASRLDAFFQMWRRLNPAPSFVIDVGANHGIWSRSALNYFPDAKYIMIEPQDHLKVHSGDLLQRPNVGWLSAGIADRVGSMMFTLRERDDSASFSVSKEYASACGYTQIEVPVTTLDEVVLREKRIPELVKIDAEGFDLKVLRGASTLIGKTEIFFVECSIFGSWESSLENVCRFMWENDYRLFGFTDFNHSPKHGNLWLSEVVFVLRSAPVWTKIDSYE